MLMTDVTEVLSKGKQGLRIELDVDLGPDVGTFVLFCVGFMDAKQRLHCADLVSSDLVSVVPR